MFVKRHIKYSLLFKSRNKHVSQAIAKNVFLTFCKKEKMSIVGTDEIDTHSFD